MTPTRARLFLVGGLLMVLAILKGRIAILRLVSGPALIANVFVTVLIALAGMAVLRWG